MSEYPSELMEAARNYLNGVGAHRNAANHANELKAELDDREKRLVEIMETLEIEYFGYADQRISLHRSIKTDVTRANFAYAKEFFDELGLTEEMFRTNVNKARLNKLVKAMRDNGKEVPDFISVFEPTKISLRKG